MTPLTPDDLLPLGEYAGKRREFFESQRRYLDRYRRVRVGPLVTLQFENRQTLWFRVQEVLRIARLSEPRLVQHQLDLFNRLLPGAGQLQAALSVDVADEARLTQQLAAWAELSDEHVRFCLGKQTVAARVLTCRPEDRCAGTTHWVQFTFDPSGRQQLTDPRQPTCVEITLPAYSYPSAPLSEEIRQSLADDLRGADASAAA